MPRLRARLHSTNNEKLFHLDTRTSKLTMISLLNPAIILWCWWGHCTKVDGGSSMGGPALIRGSAVPLAGPRAVPRSSWPSSSSLLMVTTPSHLPVILAQEWVSSTRGGQQVDLTNWELTISSSSSSRSPTPASSPGARSDDHHVTQVNVTSSTLPEEESERVTVLHVLVLSIPSSSYASAASCLAESVRPYGSRCTAQDWLNWGFGEELPLDHHHTKGQVHDLGNNDVLRYPEFCSTRVRGQKLLPRTLMSRSAEAVSTDLTLAASIELPFIPSNTTHHMGLSFRHLPPISVSRAGTVLVAAVFCPGRIDPNNKIAHDDDQHESRQEGNAFTSARKIEEIKHQGGDNDQDDEGEGIVTTMTVELRSNGRIAIRNRYGFFFSSWLALPVALWEVALLIGYILFYLVFVLAYDSTLHSRKQKNSHGVLLPRSIEVSLLSREELDRITYWWNHVALGVGFGHVLFQVLSMFHLNATGSHHRLFQVLVIVLGSVKEGITLTLVYLVALPWPVGLLLQLVYTFALYLSALFYQHFVLDTYDRHDPSANHSDASGLFFFSYSEVFTLVMFLLSILVAAWAVVVFRRSSSHAAHEEPQQGIKSEDESRRRKGRICIFRSIWQQLSRHDELRFIRIMMILSLLIALITQGALIWAKVTRSPVLLQHVPVLLAFQDGNYFVLSGTLYFSIFHHASRPTSSTAAKVLCPDDESPLPPLVEPLLAKQA